MLVLSRKRRETVVSREHPKENLVRAHAAGSSLWRVLMVDPDESFPHVYREPLAREGFYLLTAASGLECMARLRADVPDVLVLEPHILWGGGDGVLALLGQIPALAGLPVMVLSTCRDPEVVRGVAHFPISDFHVKPLAPERLAGRLRSLLAHPRRRFTLAEEDGRWECLLVQ